MTDQKQYRNILLIKPGAIGDLLQITPVIRTIKENYSDSRVSLLIGSDATARLFRYNPHLHEVMVFDKKAGHASVRSLFRLWHTVRAKRYDLVVNFQRSNLKLWFLLTAALPCRVLVYHKARGRNIHAVLNHLEAIAPLGMKSSRMDLEVRTGPDERDFADRFIKNLCNSSGPLIALNPGASHPVNRWKPERFGELADRLKRELLARVVVIGGQDDVQLAEQVRKYSSTKPEVLAGKGDLLQTAALLEKCAVVISGDTGPLHLATAVGARVVALFGAADPDRTGPVGPGHRIVRSEVPCIPCRSRTCNNKTYLECMEKLTVDSVFKEVAALIAE